MVFEIFKIFIISPLTNFLKNLRNDLKCLIFLGFVLSVYRPLSAFEKPPINDLSTFVEKTINLGTLIQMLQQRNGQVVQFQ